MDCHGHTNPQSAGQIKTKALIYVLQSTTFTTTRITMKCTMSESAVNLHVQEFSGLTD